MIFANTRSAANDELWPTLPLYPGQFTRVWEDESRNIGATIFETAQKNGINLELDGITIAAVNVVKPPFYVNWELIEIHAITPSGEKISVDVLMNEKWVALLNGTSMPIYLITSPTPPQLTSNEHVAEYLVFFCNAVYSDEGSFKIASFIQPSGTVDESLFEDKLSASKQISSVALKQLDIQSWKAVCSVNYANEVFNARFIIKVMDGLKWRRIS